jgi:hypothetical protein
VVCCINSCDSVATIIDCGTGNHNPFHSTTGCYTCRDCAGTHRTPGHLTPSNITAGDLATSDLATSDLATSDLATSDTTDWWRIWLLRSASATRPWNRPDDDGYRSP